jgi:aspartate beta-hydroxylase
MSVAHFYDHAVGAVRALYDRRIATPAILDAAHYFPDAERFTARWRDIRAEALAVAGMLQTLPRFHELMPQQAEISANDGRDWRMFIMKAYGVPVDANLKRCPTVAALLDETPEAVSCVFSFLAPGKHIPVHRGPFRAILRFHLMLSMPSDANGEPACEMLIDGAPHLLADGTSLLWDDTYPHEVWNRSDEVRIALLLDVWRNDMPADIALLSQGFMLLAKTLIRTRAMTYAA